MTAIVLVSWNLLVFFASGYFWNFSSVEVVLAFVGRPDEIHLAWAIGLIMLKYGIPWMLLVGAFFGARARRRFRTPSRAGETAAREDAASSAETLGRPPWSALVAVVFCYICMIAGLLLTFETLKTHIEFGSKALPTAVFSYVHSGLFAVAITLLAAVFLPRDRFASTSGVL